MMLWQLLSDRTWQNTSRGFKRPKGKVVWTKAEMSKDGRHRVRVSRRARVSNGWGGYVSETVVAYLRPHTEVELVAKK